MATSAQTLIVTGRVQGVGFRPFIYRLAHELQIHGWVRNCTGRVEIRIQGEQARIAEFEHRLIAQAPPLAQPQIASRATAVVDSETGFRILDSEAQGPREIHVPPDMFACDDCLSELRDPGDRRYRYPFINCTQCGPRYTLIRKLPYDRPNTAMSDFVLCADCRAEYEDPLDRRFHAEPVACPYCGPRLRFADANGRHAEGEAALAATLEQLRAGAVVAIRGIGGYHLLCDARNEAAVDRLRRNKQRPHKPLAVMVPQRGVDGCDAARELVVGSELEFAALRDPQRPIVLLKKIPGSALAASVAPGLNEVGVFLPYSPLHHLLLEDFGAPLIATSGNVSGEPVLTEPAEAERRLVQVSGAFLHHDRPILRPADDAVVRVIAEGVRPLRYGRGNAPLELELPFAVPEPVIAVGAHMKNTVALAWARRVVISPHVGDLDSPRSLSVFEQSIEDLQQLYQVEAAALVCDAHPGYASRRWAEQSGMPVYPVFHHHAHAGGVYGEYDCSGDILVFTWDGTGYGADGSIWGGEGFIGRPGEWRRASSFRTLRLPGGDRAGREPWRAAAALCWEAGRELESAPHDADIAHHGWSRNLNSPRSSAVGRLFDAAAALTGLCLHASYEGQGPMMLEAAAGKVARDAERLPLDTDAEGILRADWQPLLDPLADETAPVAQRAAWFHGVLAATLHETALRLCERESLDCVGLSGGVFQNRLLTETVIDLLAASGLRVLVPQCLPCNDAAISYGQVIEFAASRR